MSIDHDGDFTGPSVVLDRVRPARNERRFYAISLTTDLFGNILLFRNWGRIGTGGRVRFNCCSGVLSAMTTVEKLIQTKRRRGYQSRKLASASATGPNDSELIPAEMF
jgi:predicted DNA-binding WGR domain protein